MGSVGASFDCALRAWLRTRIVLQLIAAALALLLPLALAPEAAAQAAPPAAATPQLPEEPPPVPALRRGANGQIEVISPETERAEGRPLCDKGALCVGSGEAYATLAAALAAAHPGDTIDVIGGTYRQAVRLAVPNLTLRGTAGRPHFDCAGLALDDKACLAVAADGVHVDNLELSGAAGDAACIRSKAASVEIENVFCHDSGSGILASGAQIAIVHSEFYDNGGAPGGDNAAFSACDSLRVLGSVFRDSQVRSQVLSRCAKTEISDSRVVSSEGGLALDFPDGGDAMVFRTGIEKTVNGDIDEIAAFATVSCAHPGTLVLKQVDILNSRVGAVIVNGNRCAKGAISLQNVIVSGVGVATAGFIIDDGGNRLAAAPPGPQ